MTPEDQLSEISSVFHDNRITANYIGERAEIHENALVILFRSLDSGDIYGVRFPIPVLPTIGRALLGLPIESPRDWAFDARLLLMEEIDTGLIAHGAKIYHKGWVEVRISEEDSEAT